MNLDLTERMKQWREGMISDSEILGYLLEAHCEVYTAMHHAETIKAEQRLHRMHVPPFSATD